MLGAGASAAFVAEHLERIGARYADAFSAAEVAAHVRSLSTLGAEHPVATEVTAAASGEIAVTVLAFDAPGALSLVAGVLAANGLAIREGLAFSYQQQEDADAQGLGVRRHRRISRWGRVRTALSRERGAGAARGRLVDRFVGALSREAEVSVREWHRTVQAQLSEVFRRLEQGGAAGPHAARRMVSELVADRVRREFPSPPPPAPVEVRFETDGAATVAPSERAVVDSAGSPATAPTLLHVHSADVLLFLYTFTAALALRGIVVERMDLQTVRGQVLDTFALTDRSHQGIRDPDLLARIEFAVLLTKRFGYFVGAAADPYAASLRFEQLAEQLEPTPQNQNLIEQPGLMHALAVVLGSSDYLWEDFIRQDARHALSLLAVVARSDEWQSAATPDDSVQQRLRIALDNADDGVAALNEFKDHEIFVIDLEHLLGLHQGVHELSERLSVLADAVVAAALELAAERLRERFGQPLTVAGIPAEMAVLGLGKLGGRALGYASDVELLFVYADDGHTSGSQRVSNHEYYVELVDETVRSIRAKRQGIFEVDLKLRPFGASGPRAVRLDTFAKYYAGDGEALAYERLALIRLRAVAGNRELGRRVERVRDHLLYTGELDLSGIRDTRAKQVAAYDGEERINAKYSPGTLVDVEYSVQLLQVRYGHDDDALRTPSVRGALSRMAESGVLERAEAEHLVESYTFFRRLINGLRMLRGSAKDLYLPPVADSEFDHLARRIGYAEAGGQTPAQQLHVELELQRARVAEFASAHAAPLLSSSVASLADLVLRAAAEPDEEKARAAARAMQRLGMQQPRQALASFRTIAARATDSAAFAQLAVVAGDLLAEQPAPQRALNNWERYVAAVEDPEAAFQRWRTQPTELALLLRVMATSQFLADHLVRQPEVFDWLADARYLRRPFTLGEVRSDLASEAAAASDNADWLRRLRLWRRRHLLRIATRDYCLAAPLGDVVAELTVVAEAAIAMALDRAAASASATTTALSDPAARAAAADRACIVAFGKLGGAELNYSSDLDLIMVFDDAGLSDREREAMTTTVAALAGEVRATLATHTAELFAYRVDWRLRPYGSSGEMVHTLSGLFDYYRDAAGDWEVQALLKARPVAGSAAVRERVAGGIAAAFERVTSLPEQQRGEQVFAAVRERRARATQLRAAGSDAVDVKSGVGGIRDAEFLVQGLQLVHLQRLPQLHTGNTLEALDLLAANSLLDAAQAAAIRDDYIFLRRVEHTLQIFDDRQVHSLPAGEEALLALSRQLFGPDADRARLEREVSGAMSRTRSHFDVITAPTVGSAPAVEGAAADDG